jgi:flagellar hook-associated protein FlgK
MSDLLSISSTAVMAYQRALGTVSNNIANVGTEGYSRQDVSLTANTPSKQGNVYIGNGVRFAGIQRQVDDFVQSNLRNSQSELTTQEPMVSYANRVIDIMGGESTGLTSALNQFFDAARDLSADPASGIQRANFMAKSDTVTSRFRELSGQLGNIGEETKQAIEVKVTELNTLIGQLALVNKQLAKAVSVDKQPPELLDQRDRVLQQISSLSRIATKFDSKGAVSVSLGDSMQSGLVLEGGYAKPLNVTFSDNADGKVDLVIDLYGKSPQGLASLGSGEIGGLLSFREQVLTPARNALDDLAKTFVSEVNAIHRDSLDAYGNPGGDLFALDRSFTYVSQGMTVALDDPLKIAAASQFRVIESPFNPSPVDAVVSYEAPAPRLPADISDILVNNPNASAAKTVTIGATQPFAMLTTIGAGTQDAVVYLDDLQAGQQVQVLTREGVHVLGSELSFEAQDMVLRQNYGFEADALYGTNYLNQTDELAYRKSDLFLGAKALPALGQVFDDAGAPMDGMPLEATLESARLATSLVNNESGEVIAAGALTLNGQALGALVAGGDVLQATEVADWLNTTTVPGLTIRASNEIVVPESQLKLGSSLTLKTASRTAVTITPPAGGFADATELAAAINAQRLTSGVEAQMNPDGALVLQNLEQFAGEHITIGPSDLGGAPDNALGLSAGSIAGKISMTRALDDPKDNQIRIGLGPNGTAVDLQTIGLRMGVYVEGTSSDAYMVMVQGQGTFKAAASYGASQLDPKQALRDEPFDITFVADDRYTITDKNTGTVVGTRQFDPGVLPAEVSYRGITLTFTSAPLQGDVFTVDGNHDGVGNNEGALRLVELENLRVVPGGKTLSEAYIQEVSDVGNIAQQALVAKDALTVVYDQAVEARDAISGVSLDEEAASLIRFQQAYQASAKVMQTASTLFDAILRVN